MNAVTPVRLCSLVALFLIPVTAGCAADASQSPSPSAPGSPGTLETSAQNCGVISMLGSNAPADPAAQQAESCFMAAYNACRAATLTVENRGADVKSTTVFTLRSEAACRIDGTTETILVPATRVTSSFTCARITAKDGGLLFVGCGRSGDIFVPQPRP